MCVKQCSPCDFPETVATIERTQTLHATSGAQPSHSTASRLIALVQTLSNRRRQPHCFSSLRLTYTQSICDGSKTFHSIAIHNTCQSPAANHCTQDSQTWHNDVILVTLHEVGGKQRQSTTSNATAGRSIKQARCQPEQRTVAGAAWAKNSISSAVTCRAHCQHSCPSCLQFTSQRMRITTQEQVTVTPTTTKSNPA